MESNINLEKGSPPIDAGKTDYLQKRHNDIQGICEALSKATSTFNSIDTYEAIERYQKEHKRWFYSDISNYLFQHNTEVQGTFLTNLETLQGHCRGLHVAPREGKSVEPMAIMIDKLWDHSNLAQMQSATLREDDGAFQTRFEKHIAPFKARFSHEMNMQLISLIGIFTALSFIVFGGISSLDNVFEGVLSVPIIELAIVGAIWSLCILNLVFIFMIFVSKLTKLPIKSDDSPNASVVRRYPFMVWSNFVLLLILSVFSFLNYIDYSNSGGWLLDFSRNHSFLFSCIGFCVIIILFAILAIILCICKGNHSNKKPSKEKHKRPDPTAR